MVNKKRDEDSIEANHSSPYVEKTSEEKFLVDMLGMIVDRLKKNYDFCNKDIFELCLKEKESVLMVPIQIFASELAPAESLVKYLKETFDLNYHDLSELIQRNERGVWASYQRAKKKMPSEFIIKDPTMIPVSIFKDKSLSILECVITYLKNVKQIKGIKIARLLNKHPANIWTIYNRAKNKQRK
jgi:hypothetical protein